MKRKKDIDFLLEPADLEEFNMIKAISTRG